MGSLVFAAPNVDDPETGRPYTTDEIARFFEMCWGDGATTPAEFRAGSLGWDGQTPVSGFHTVLIDFETEHVTVCSVVRSDGREECRDVRLTLLTFESADDNWQHWRIDYTDEPVA